MEWSQRSIESYNILKSKNQFHTKGKNYKRNGMKNNNHKKPSPK